MTFVKSLVDEIRTAHSKVQTVYKKNLDMGDKDGFFNERALSVSLQFAMLSLQAINIIGIEELMDTGEDISKLLGIICTFNESSLEMFAVAERKQTKYPRPQRLTDYVELARRYYAVVPLFFWWVTSSRKENCDVGYYNSS